MTSAEDIVNSATVSARKRYSYKKLADICGPETSDITLIGLQNALAVACEIVSDERKLTLMCKDMGPSLVKVLSHQLQERSGSLEAAAVLVLSMLRLFVCCAGNAKSSSENRKYLCQLGLVPVLLYSLTDSALAAQHKDQLLELLSELSNDQNVCRQLYADGMATVLLDAIGSCHKPEQIKLSCMFWKNLFGGRMARAAESLHQDGAVLPFLLAVLSKVDMPIEVKILALEAIGELSVGSVKAAVGRNPQLHTQLLVILTSSERTELHDNYKVKAAEVLYSLTYWWNERYHAASAQQLLAAGFADTALAAWHYHLSSTRIANRVNGGNSAEAVSSVILEHLYWTFCNLACEGAAAPLHEMGVACVLVDLLRGKLDGIIQTEMRLFSTITAIERICRGSTVVAGKLYEEGLVAALVHSWRPTNDYCRAAVGLLTTLANSNSERKLHMYQEGIADLLLQMVSGDLLQSTKFSCRELYKQLRQHEEVARLMTEKSKLRLPNEEF